MHIGRRRGSTEGIHGDGIELAPIQVSLRRKLSNQQRLVKAETRELAVIKLVEIFNTL